MKYFLSVTLLVGFFFVISEAQASTTLSDVPSPPSEALLIRGEVLDIEGNVFIIKTKDGELARVRVYRGTVQDETIKKGDHIEARVLPEWQALVIRQQH